MTIRDAALLLLSVLLATAQYYAIERPIWKAPSSRTVPDAWERWKRTHRYPARLASLAGIGSLTLVFCAVITLPPAYAQPAVERSGLRGATAEVNDHVVQALNARWFPEELRPSIDGVSFASRVDAWVRDGCLAAERLADDPVSTAARCTYGRPDAPRTAVLIGDSIAISWLPAIQEALGGDWSIRVLTMARCPYASVDVVNAEGSLNTDCARYHPFVRDELARLQPDLVIASQADSVLTRLASGVVGDAAARELAKGTRDALQHAASHSNQLVVLGAPPTGRGIMDCYIRVAGPHACGYPIHPTHTLHGNVIKQAIDDLGGDATYISADPWFCGQAECSLIVDGYVTMPDGTHLSQDYAEYLGPAVAQELEELLEQ